ncbi:MAG: hypothetical protein Q8M39_07710 [Sulfuricurvum sp.]|nr:hypothetical protein [Sulfuricurvum sp.]
MQGERNKIIRYALDFYIEDVNTYSGYKGDLIVKITTKDKEAVIAIRKYALSLGVKDIVVKHNPNLVLYELYCVTANEDVYHIKIEDLMSETNHKS